jgi:hypothetical protein
MRPLFLIPIVASLAGCATPLDAPLSPRFGEAVASMQAQVIPAAISSAPPQDPGARAVAAITRLQKGEVRKPESPATSTVGAATAMAPGK